MKKTKRQILRGKTTSQQDGQLYFKFKLPDSVSPGEINVEFLLDQKVIYTHTIRVNQRKQPAFSITVPENQPPFFYSFLKINSSSGPHVIGSSLRCVAQVNYRNGSNYTDGQVEWKAEAQPTSFSPTGFFF